MKLFKNAKTKVSLMLSALGIMALNAVAFAAPATGNTTIDTMLTNMETGFSTAESAFTYLALAAIPVTLAVVLFFWLRGKFKQSVSGA